MVIDKSNTALQAENTAFLSELSNREINLLTVCESEAISSLISRETSEAAPMILAAPRAILECDEERSVGSRARMGLTEDLERRRELRNLNKHLLIKGRVVWGWFESDASNKANRVLRSEN